MKRHLLLAPAALLAAFFVGRQAIGQQGETFGTLRTSVPDPYNRGSSGLPQGAEPAQARPTSSRRSAPAPANPFPLTAQAGAWLVCAAHFGGPDGFDLACQTARILREKHRMHSFILNRADDVRARYDAEWEQVKKRYPGAVLPRRTVRVEDEYAVLVGGFRDFNAATASLPTFRKLPMPALHLESGRNPFTQLFTAEPTADKKKLKVNSYKLSPFLQAVVVRNPQVPRSEAKLPPDPALKELNAGEQYSLLKNPKPYTLVVKYYGGAQSIQSVQGDEKDKKGSGFMSMLGFGGSKQGSALVAGASQADELARLLRHPRFGFDSYVMHMRTGSLVAVGGFTGPKDPTVAAMLRRLKSLHFNVAGGADPIGLMAIPRMIEVPRF